MPTIWTEITPQTSAKNTCLQVIGNLWETSEARFHPKKYNLLSFFIVRVVPIFTI